MGVAASKIEDDKALLLCRDRKRFVRQALDRRCLLADSHVSYIQSLRNIGTALRTFVEPDAPVESSLYTSTSATPGPPALTEKSVSQFSNLSFPQTLETGESISPVPSPLSSTQFHVNHMKAVRSFSTTVEEKPPSPVIATVNTNDATPKRLSTQREEKSSLDTASPSPGAPPWDYFGLFPPSDELSFHDGKGLDHDFGNVDEIRRVREEEDIPELEEHDEASTNGRDFESDDDFDQSPNEPLVRMFKNRNVVSEHQFPSESPTIQNNRNVVLEHQFPSESPTIQSMDIIARGKGQQIWEKIMLNNARQEIQETPSTTPSRATSFAGTPHVNGRVKETTVETKLGEKHFLFCMKEIENLFIKASESGREVPRMLEANKLQFRPLFPEENSNGSKVSSFLTTCFSCCAPEEVPQPQVATPSDIKYLTWDRSVSSLSSSSRVPLGSTSKDDIDDLSSNAFSTMCMNSGSHASTLDRLFAWERKLYDEVKASGVIRREYDMKCKQLQQQESRGESDYKIDKTRATVKDLHSRIRVAIHRIYSISKRIEELRDRELQPQLDELIEGLSLMWTMMLECHKNQHDIIISLSDGNSNTKVTIRSEFQRQVMTLLEFELNSLCSNFTKWTTAQKSYLQAINGWLLKCVFPFPFKGNKSKRSRRQQPFSPRKNIAPPIFVTCKEWLEELDKLPTKEVADSIKDLVTLLTSHSLPRQEKGHPGSNLSFSLSRKAVQADKLGENGGTHESSIDWSLNYDSLHTVLVAFLSNLKDFASSSVTMYEKLKFSVREAREIYENK